MGTPVNHEGFMRFTLEFEGSEGSEPVVWEGCQFANGTVVIYLLVPFTYPPAIELWKDFPSLMQERWPSPPPKVTWLDD